MRQEFGKGASERVRSSLAQVTAALGISRVLVLPTPRTYQVIIAPHPHVIAGVKSWH